MRWNIAPGQAYQLRRAARKKRLVAFESIEARHLLSVAINEFSLGRGYVDYGDAMVAGPDGNLWFTDGAEILQMDPSTHEISQFPLPNPMVVNGAPVVGTDGNIWFPAYNGVYSGSLLSVSPTTHAITDVPVPSGGIVRNLIAAPDGTIWFDDQVNPSATNYENQPPNIGEVQLATHTISEFPLPDGGVYGLVKSPDGNLWCTESYEPLPYSPNVANFIVKFSVSSDTTQEFSVPTDANVDVHAPPDESAPTVAPDGDVYFAYGNSIFDVNPATDAISQFNVSDSGRGLDTSLVVGSDGNLWFDDGHGLGSLNITTHTISEGFPGGDYYQTLTSGPDGNLWFENFNQGSAVTGSSLQLGDFNPVTHALRFYTVAGTALGGPAPPYPITAAYGGLWFVLLYPESGGASDIVEADVTAPPANTQVALVFSSANPAIPGQSVTLSANVVSSRRQDNAPTGTVTFYDGVVEQAHELGTGTLAGVPGDDVATFQTSSLALGAHNITAVYPGDSDFQGSQSTPLVVNVNPNLNALYVTAVYQDVLGRAPDPNGLAYWSQKLDGGMAVSSVAEQIGKSDEYYQNFVIKPDYLKVLGRAADADGLSHWTAKMDSGATDQQLEADLAASDEVYATAGGTDLAWVDSVYKLLLNRTAEPDGEKYWTGKLTAGASRIDVAQGIAGSQENNTQLINEDYFHYLGRAADADGLAFWLTRFAEGQTNEDVVAGFTGSDEYYKKHTS